MMAGIEEKASVPVDQEDVEDRSGPHQLVLYQAVALKGEHELKRPTGSLFWSGIAAGIGISASLIAQGALHAKLPQAAWSEVIADMGYTVGFLLVILGRMQLFTEHTVVAVLPVVAAPTKRNWQLLARLWALVFAANQIGVFVAAWALTHGGLAGDRLVHSMLEVSHHLLDRSFAETLLQAIPGGFLIAAVAWVIVASKGGHFWIVFALTYAIALGDFAHVIAGSCEAYALVLMGDASAGWALGGFVVPALIGNVIGGTGLFAVLAFAQIREEM